jgi:hypothetical protein
LADSIGIASFTLEDDVFLRPAEAWRRLAVPADRSRPMVIGEAIRDWFVSEVPSAFFPYDSELQPIAPEHPDLRTIWPYRTSLANNKLFGGKTKIEGGLNWYEYGRFTTDKLRTPLTIAFAFVATHNHFVLDRGGKVFKQSAPIIKLKEGATEDDHLALLAYLNSSTACFWMKQVFYPKATSNKDLGDIQGKEEANRFEFAGTQLATMPVPTFDAVTRKTLVELARELLALGVKREALSGACAVERIAEGEDPGEVTRQLASQRASILERMRVLQEDVDWCVYRATAMASTFSLSPLGVPAPVRPFEAERMGSEVSPCWASRASLLRASPSLRMIETVVFKRPWDGHRGIFGHGVKSIDEELHAATVEWLAAQVERLVGLDPMTRALPAVLRLLTPGQRFQRVIDSVRGRAQIVREAVARDAVPFLARYRHTEVGLEKRAQWERVWSLQRAEDRGETVPAFDAPPKYDQKDYRDATIWRLRGKLDVPKERFISYPGCESDEDKEPVYGWAGWNHLQQAIALATLYLKRKQGEAWGTDRLVPMLAGLDELLPWIWQWHPEPTPESGGVKPGQYIADFLSAQCQELGVTLDEVRAWRPESKKNNGAGALKRTRTPKKSKVAAEGETP